MYNTKIHYRLFNDTPERWLFIDNENVCTVMAKIF